MSTVPYLGKNGFVPSATSSDNSTGFPTKLFIGITLGILLALGLLLFLFYKRKKSTQKKE